MSVVFSMFCVLFSILLAFSLLWSFVMLIAVTIGLILDLLPRNGSKKCGKSCERKSNTHA